MTTKSDTATEFTDLPDDAHAVFRGLALAGMSSNEIAGLCAVTPAMAEEWARGWTQVPRGRLVFLTMLLAHLVDDLVETYAGWGSAPQDWHRHMQSRIEGARDALMAQQAANEAAPAGAIRQGVRLFRSWQRRDAAVAVAAEATRRVALGRDPAGLTL